MGRNEEGGNRVLTNPITPPRFRVRRERNQGPPLWGGVRLLYELPCRPEGTAVGCGQLVTPERLRPWSTAPAGGSRAVHTADHHVPTNTLTYSNGCHTGA